MIKKSKLNNVTYFASGFVDIIELIAFVRHEVLRKVFEFSAIRCFV